MRRAAARPVLRRRAPVRSRPKRPCDHHLLNLIRALADREDLRVAVEAADRVLLDEAIAAMDLNRLFACANGHAPRLELRVGSGEREGAALVLQPRGLVREHARGL